MPEFKNLVVRGKGNGGGCDVTINSPQNGEWELEMQTDNYQNEYQWVYLTTEQIDTLIAQLQEWRNG